MLFHIIMWQTLTDDFLGLHKNMNCAFPLISFRISLMFLKKHEIFWEAATHAKHMLRSSCTFFYYLSEAVTRSLKKQEIFPEAATHTKKKMFKSSCTNFHGCCTHFAWRILKNILMVIKPKALHVPWSMLLFHQPVQASYHRLCLELSYAYWPCKSCASYSQTTFAPFILFHHQTGRSYSHQM